MQHVANGLTFDWAGELAPASGADVEQSRFDTAAGTARPD
jgi:hypothetical protein